ncbi:hypothetical protein [Edaphosphingomonas haloaromaticamans]|uniref:Uncharacterized protein n=1 Tax=Edaphosphingomonas haloaromaticamans TaxID=653954 RepID=A0A1S1HFT5_9SPHN|nr:hypothetical protein [Sphingomonas haloaromaticamans]OHT20063.1 hypothetical protein BHE75_02057 [Sphingomonas haloaromaticamans]
MFDIPMNHFKSVFAYKFFVVPSDLNYFLARFTNTYGISEEFWWQALQTIEKLLKAGLILNGVSVKSGYNHDIEKLWCKHKEVFGDLAVTNLRRPDKLSQKLWNDRPLESLIARVNQMGHPDSRYGLLSYANENDDLFKFDQLVFELRRRTVGLDWIVGNDFSDDGLTEFYGQPYRDVIVQRPERQIRSMKIPDGSLGLIGENLEDVIYSWNFPFFRNGSDLERPAPPAVAPVIAGFGNSYLYLLLEKLKDSEITELVSERVDWLLGSVKIPLDAEEELRRILVT